MAMHDSQPRSLALVLAIGLAGLAIFPIFGADEKFYMQFLAKIMVMAIFAMSLDLLIGYGGLVSLGHAMYFGLAGYTLICSPAITARVGSACARSAVRAAALWWVFVARTSGIYFIMVTLGSSRWRITCCAPSYLCGATQLHYMKAVLSLFAGSGHLDSLRRFYYVIIAALVGV